MIYLVVAFFGLIFGSFLNVCIARIPLGLSVVGPRSNCPRCHHPIRWYDNIPVASYVFLRGRCRDCHEPISLTYPVVEGLNAALLLAAYSMDGLTLQFLRDAIFIMILLVLVFTDLFERRLPHAITMPGIIAGLLLSWFVPVDSRPIVALLRYYGVIPPAVVVSPLGSATGAVVAGGLFYVVGEVFYRMRKIPGLGFGDVMLMILVGSFLGLPLALLTVLLGSLLGLLVAIPFVILNRARYWRFAWPYGSFLGAAAIYTCLWGNDLINSYLRWSGVVT